MFFRTTKSKGRNIQLVRVIRNHKCLLCLPVKVQMVSVKFKTNFCVFFPVYSLRFHPNLQNRQAHRIPTKPGSSYVVLQE